MKFRSRRYAELGKARYIFMLLSAATDFFPNPGLYKLFFVRWWLFVLLIFDQLIMMKEKNSFYL